jgi:hypothetical protein
MSDYVATTKLNPVAERSQQLFLLDTRYGRIGESIATEGDRVIHQIGPTLIKAPARYPYFEEDDGGALMDRWDQFGDPFDGPEERLERASEDDDATHVRDYRNQID